MNLLTIFDLGFLVVFSLFLIIFLYSRRKNLDREGIMYLYRTKWGIKLINYVGGKYKKTLKVLSYFSVTLGYILMGTMLYLFGKIVYIYIAYPQIVREIKIPPIMPLVPYLPQIFKLDFLPPFYFTYWIIIIAIIAVTHEFSHGIFAKYNKIKVKSTGFGFLGPFLAAFVEPDEKQMKKKSIFAQLSILSAGTFANVLTAIFFLAILILVFFTGFVASGVVFDSYSYSIVPISAITAINGISVGNQDYNSFLKEIENKTIYNLTTDNKSYLGIEGFFSNSKDYVKLYDNAPAINAKLVGAITKINSVKIKNIDELKIELDKYEVGGSISIETEISDEVKEYQITLEKHPNGDSVWLGIGFVKKEGSGIISNAYNKLSSFREDYVYYKAKNSFVIFIYNLLWWIILISISVALVNMLPLGIFDGGRVFYLTFFAILKDENKAKKVFSWMTGFLLLLLLVLMFFWIFSF